LAVGGGVGVHASGKEKAVENLKEMNLAARKDVTLLSLETMTCLNF
jgi:hypothetical protein